MKTILTICKDTRKGSPHKWGVNTCKPSVRSIIALQKPDCDSLLIFYVSNVLNSDAQISLELGDNGAFPHERNLKTAGNGVRFPWLNAICSKGYSAFAIIFQCVVLLHEQIRYHISIYGQLNYIFSSQSAKTQQVGKLHNNQIPCTANNGNKNLATRRFGQMGNTQEKPQIVKRWIFHRAAKEQRFK